jgi:hypothetical protein
MRGAACHTALAGGRPASAGASSPRPRPKPDVDLAAPDPPQPIAELADAVVRIGAGIALLLDHLTRGARGAPPDAEPIDRVLHRQVTAILAEHLDDLPPPVLRAAVAVLGRVQAALGHDLFLADPLSRPEPLSHLRPPPGRGRG